MRRHRQQAATLRHHAELFRSIGCPLECVEALHSQAMQHELMAVAPAAAIALGCLLVLVTVAWGLT